MTALLLVPALARPGEPTVWAAAGAVQTVAQRAGLCAWANASIGQKRYGDDGFIDTDALYLVTGSGFVQGHSIRLSGRFPYARYMSVTVYGGPALGAIDHLADRSIMPDHGSINPFRPRAKRHAAKRSYTLYIVQGPPPVSGRVPNTLYTGPYHPVLVMYRIFAPDHGADPYGNVQGPHIDVLNGSPTSFSSAASLPACASPAPLMWRSGVWLTTALQWKRVGAQANNGANDDTAYLDVRLDRSDAYLIRFKAPSYADTYHDQPISGRENVRMWSVCQYDMYTEKVVACLHDYETARDRQGYVTIIVSMLANRPNLTKLAQGTNWLPFGPESTGLLVYRQILPAPSFVGNFHKVAPDAPQSEIQRTLGSYFPTIEPIHVLS